MEFRARSDSVIGRRVENNSLVQAQQAAILLPEEDSLAQEILV